MAHFTTVMQTSCKDPSRSSIGLDCCGDMITRATPTTMAKITACNMLLSTMELRGLAGMRPMSVCGNLPMSNTPGAAALTAAGTEPNEFCSAAASTNDPGSITEASQIPMTTARAVVAIKYSATLKPIRRSCSKSSVAARPRMIEANTRGMTII